MILGMSVAMFTVAHVVISIVGILSGLLAMLGMIANRPLGATNAVFLATSLLTSLTGLLFGAPFDPAQVIGVLSLGILAAALAALYAGNLRGKWRVTYVVTAALALYLNCFVAVVQAFQKIDALHALAPTQPNHPSAWRKEFCSLCFSPVDSSLLGAFILRWNLCEPIINVSNRNTES